MISLKWGLSKASIWLDELPEWQYKGTETIERQIESTKSYQPINQSSAIELFVPIGARFYYGALSVTFAPSIVGSLVVQLPILESEVLLQGALVSNTLDTVFIGFLPEYTEGIFDGLLNTDTAELLGSGKLSISGAAHGAVSSSLWMFKLLSRIAVKLLTLEKEDISDEQLIKLIQESWVQTRKK